MKKNGETILEKKVRTEELEKFLEDIENKTIVLEPTTKHNLCKKTQKEKRSSSLSSIQNQIDSRI